MIGHGGLLRAFSFACLRACLGDLPPDMPGDLGCAMQFNADTEYGNNR